MIILRANFVPSETCHTSKQKTTYIAGQTLVLFHEALILLVNLEHFADAISCGFRLLNNKKIK